MLGVPVEIPQVQFLDKFDTPVVCNDRCRSRSLGSCSSWTRLDTPVMRVFFDKVVDVPVVLCNGVLQVQFIEGYDVPMIMHVQR